ncbi:hypothetical protein M9Y10_030756 [Tritrichomonas musculus]|uniref:Uncharacterized protein n=1 Tax=Tritrichomonas musculus TaxID=1915356 RepID=A0ABR2H2W5_9EUKA
MAESKVSLRPTAEKLLGLPMFCPMTNVKRIFLPKSNGKSFSMSISTNSRIDVHKSMTFGSDQVNSSEDDNENESNVSTLAHLHSYKSSNRFPSLQRINCHFQPVKPL